VKNYFIFLTFLILLAVGLLAWNNFHTQSIAKTISFDQVNQSAANFTILPGPAPIFSCPVQRNSPTIVSIIKTPGLSSYKINGVTYYVLRRGSKANIVYSAGSKTGFVNSQSNAIRVAYPGAQNATNQTYNLTFYHQAQATENYTITQTNSSSNQSQYKICDNIATLGTICSYQTSKPNALSTSVSVTSFTHPGISSRNVKASAGLQNITINATQSATQGTYWVSVAGGPCNGGQLSLLTIGNGEYNGTVNASTAKYS